MCHSRSRRRLRRFHRLSTFDDIGAFAGDFRGHRPWRGPSGSPQRSRTPSAITILLAGLAVFALVKLLTASNRPNLSTAQKVGLGVLVLFVASVLLSLRRSARRYNWSM